MANWGADFWGAYSDVAKARMAQAAFAQQQAGMRAFGNAMTDPNIFMPGAPQGGQQPGGGDMSNYENAIASIESGGGRGRTPNYTAVGPRTKTGDRAYGRYQVMGNNIGPWTQEALGRRETPQQFLQDPQAQNSVFDKRFGGYLKQTGSPQDAASMWFTGRPLAQGKNARDVNGMSGQSYADAFTKALGQSPQQVAQTASAIGGVPPGQLSWQHIVQAIQAKNPGLDPASLAEAVQLFEPLMSQQSQMDWREQNLQLRELTEADRERTAAANEAGRNARAGAHEEGVQTRFDITQDRLYKALQQRADEFKQKMAASKTKADRDYYARQRKANNDQRHQRATEAIARGSFNQQNPMSADEQKAALDAEDQRWQDENNQIDAEASASADDNAGAATKGGRVGQGAFSASNAAGKSYDENTAKKAYIDGGGTEAGWAHIKDKKIWMP